MGLNIPECNEFIVLVDEISRAFTMNDPAEDTIGSRHFS
jgi:hypothetical protein